MKYKFYEEKKGKNYSSPASKSHAMYCHPLSLVNMYILLNRCGVWRRLSQWEIAPLRKIDIRVLGNSLIIYLLFKFMPEY